MGSFLVKSENQTRNLRFAAIVSSARLSNCLWLIELRAALFESSQLKRLRLRSGLCLSLSLLCLSLPLVCLSHMHRMRCLEGCICFLCSVEPLCGGIGGFLRCYALAFELRALTAQLSQRRGLL